MFFVVSIVVGEETVRNQAYHRKKVYENRTSLLNFCEIFLTSTFQSGIVSI